MKGYHLIGRKIVGVGQNYACHAKEMGASILKTSSQTPPQSPPPLFLKPPSSYVIQPNPIRLPEGHDCHHEGMSHLLLINLTLLVELGVIMGKTGSNISKEVAMNYVSGFTLALDITARDIQSEAKRTGMPWTISKGYDTFCPISSFISLESLPNYQNIDIWLKVNGILKQHGNTADMMMDIPSLIEYISSIMRLERGDLILTGTPKGVGPIKVGDQIMAGIGHDIVKMNFRVVPKPKRMKN